MSGSLFYSNAITAEKSTFVRSRHAQRMSESRSRCQHFMLCGFYLSASSGRWCEMKAFEKLRCSLLTSPADS